MSAGPLRYRLAATRAPRLLHDLFRRARLEVTVLQAETWRYEDARLRIEHVAGLGWFCEIEAPDGSTDRLERIAGEFGFRAEDLEPRDYAQLLAGGEESTAAPAPPAEEAPATAPATPEAASAPRPRRVGTWHYLLAAAILLAAVLIFGPVVGLIVGLAVVAAGAAIVLASGIPA